MERATWPLDDVGNPSGVQVDAEHVGGVVGPVPRPDGLTGLPAGQVEAKRLGHVRGERLPDGLLVLRQGRGQDDNGGCGSQLEPFGGQGCQFSDPETRRHGGKVKVVPVPASQTPERLRAVQGGVEDCSQLLLGERLPIMPAVQFDVATFQVGQGVDGHAACRSPARRQTA